jgi:hypothetical protein
MMRLVRSQSNMRQVEGWKLYAAVKLFNDGATLPFIARFVAMLLLLRPSIPQHSHEFSMVGIAGIGKIRRVGSQKTIFDKCRPAWTVLKK